MVPGVVGSNPISHPSTLASAGVFCCVLVAKTKLRQLNSASKQDDGFIPGDIPGIDFDKLIGQWQVVAFVVDE